MVHLRSVGRDDDSSALQPRRAARQQVSFGVDSALQHGSFARRRDRLQGSFSGLFGRALLHSSAMSTAPLLPLTAAGPFSRALLLVAGLFCSQQGSFALSRALLLSAGLF